KWTPMLVQQLEHSSVMADLSSDLDQRGAASDLIIDRPTASRLGITPAQIDNTLYDAFGQRQASVIYSGLNQYHVVVGIGSRDTQLPASLRDMYVSTSGGSPSGTQKSNAPAGTVVAAGDPVTSSAPAASAVAVNANNNAARNAATNQLANRGRGSASSGA